MKKRILSILLTLCMVLCLMPTAAFAEGGTASADITGTGTAEDPYLIYTAAGLKEFQRRVNAAERDAHAKLVSDIVLNDGTFDEDGNYTKGESGMDAEKWEPICDFRGTFDGNGKTIKGLYVNGEEYAGLFGGSPFAATVKNVAVTGYVSGKTAGGIAGEMLSGSISNCLNYCTVTGSDRAGGIVGSSDAMINSCGNRGSVSGSKVVGGIIGDLNSNTIANCYNTGTVSVSGSWMRVGGIVGSAGSGTGITNCYNAGSVSGSAGGSDIEQLLIGGIAGDSGYNTIANCYNVGQVSSADGTDCMGGIVGRQTKGTVNNCYYTTGVADNGIGYTDYSPTVTNTEAKSKSDFADGTVLNLLKNGDENSPWTKCGYLNAAGMTLPLLDWQTADAHTHNKNGDFGGCDCGQLPVGTADDPYLISNAEELKRFRDMVNGGNTGICAKLMNDIVLNDGTFDENGNYTKGTSGKDADMWMPINGYGGTFDGDGHTIQGVYVNYGGDAGLFSSASGATIKGLTITGYIKGKDRVGGIVGYMSSGTITGCRNAAVVRGEQSSYIACGGIAGRLTTGTIANCENVGSVQATPSGNGLEVGGIVGHAGSYNTSAIFEACANLGSVTAIVDDAGGYARVGGITGFVAQHVDLIDCYNAGSLLLTEQKGTPADSCLGGIFGCKFDGVYSSESELPSASNCYNVGTMTHTGNGKVAIGDIGGETPNIKIINCYGLTAHTKAEFADGTVLALLKGDRTDSPWAKTDYLNAAGMTLPLLDWQTPDAHTHNYQWKYDDTEHWKECSCGLIEQGSKAAHKEVTGICTDGIQCACGYEMHTATGGHSYPADWTAVRPGSTHSKACTNPGCGVTKTESCTGGTATCTEQATCEICGEKYGDLKPHSYSPDWRADETNHWHECSECGAKADEAEHTDTDKDHKCDVCEKVLSECADTNKDHKCDLCGKVLSEHTGGTATCKDKAVCEVCGESYGELDSNNHADMKHIEAKAATKTAEGNIEYWYCDGCGKYFADKDGNKEITKADTVTAKLPDEKPTSPKTGDTSNLALWIALLFISGGVITVTTVVSKKKRHS